MEEAAQLAVSQMLPLPTTRNSQRSPTGTPASKRVGRTFHHCRSETSKSGGITKRVSLHSLRHVDVAIFEPDNLASAKSTAIAEGEHHLIPEATGHGKQPLR